MAVTSVSLEVSRWSGLEVVTLITWCHVLKLVTMVHLPRDRIVILIVVAIAVLIWIKPLVRYVNKILIMLLNIVRMLRHAIAW